MTEAVLWQWAKDNGYTPESLAEKLGYTSPRYVELVLRGWEQMSDKFVGRFFQTFPQDAIKLFTDLPSPAVLVDSRETYTTEGENDA